MLFGHFRVDRPVGTGHSRPNDVKRVRRALNETGHAASPPDPSGRYDASASAAIERFQRDFALKPDGVILPDGPTAQLLDLAIAVKRNGGAEALDRLRDRMGALSREGIHLAAYGAGEDQESIAFLDERGAVVPPTRLATIFDSHPETRGLVRMALQSEGDPDAPRNGNRRGDEANELRVANAAAIQKILEVMGKLVIKGKKGVPPAWRVPVPQPPVIPAPQPEPKPERSEPPVPPPEPEDRRRTGAGRTVPTDLDTRIPPFPGQPPEGFDDREEFPAIPRGPVVLPGPEIEEARPGVFVFPNLQGEFDDWIIVEDRRGNEETRLHLEKVRDFFWKNILGSDPNWIHKAGGRDKKTGKEKPEFWIPGPQKAMEEVLKTKIDGRKGGKFVDLTFKNTVTDEIVHVQTVDTDRNGKPTERELDNAEIIRRATKFGRVYLVPKPKKRSKTTLK